MKKKLLAVVSLLVALVMSFCLIACGNKNDGKDQVPQLTPSKLETAVGNIQNAKTLELDISGSSVSNKTNAEEFSANVVVSGNKVKYTEPTTDASYIFDLDTGYCYFEDDDGKYYYVDQMLPAGLFDYADDVMAANFGEVGNVDYSEIVKQFSYDKTYGGFVASFDVKDDVNAVLKFAQDAYADDANLNDVIDSLLLKATGDDTVTLEAILDLLCGDGYTMLKNVPLQMLLGEDADELFNELFAALEEAGVTLSAESKQAIKNRKIGEIAAGAMAVVDEIVDGEELDPGVILNAVFFYPYSEAQIDNAGVKLSMYADMLIDFLQSTKVRAIVDEAPDDIKAMIATRGFEFTAITSTFGFKLNGNKITEVMCGEYIEHNYTGKDYQSSAFIGDNKFEVTLTVGIATSNKATDFDVEFGDDDEVVTYVMAIVGAYDTKNAVIPYETCGKEVEVTIVGAMYMNGTTGAYGAIDADEIIFEAEKNNFIVTAEAAAQVLENCNNDVGTLMVAFTVTVDEEEEDGILACVVVPDTSIEVFSGIISGIFNNIM